MMMRALYSLLTYAAQPWVRRKLARRAKVEPLYGEWVEQRFGHYDGVLRGPKGERVPVDSALGWLGETHARW